MLQRVKYTNHKNRTDHYNNHIKPDKTMNIYIVKLLSCI